MIIGRTELVERLAAATGGGRAAARVYLAALEDVVGTALAAGDSIKLSGFLAIEAVDRAERTGRNPRTGEPLVIPAGRAVKATPGAQLKAAVKP